MAMFFGSEGKTRMSPMPMRVGGYDRHRRCGGGSVVLEDRGMMELMYGLVCSRVAPQNNPVHHSLFSDTRAAPSSILEDDLVAAPNRASSVVLQLSAGSRRRTSKSEEPPHKSRKRRGRYCVLQGSYLPLCFHQARKSFLVHVDDATSTSIFLSLHAQSPTPPIY